MAYAALVSLKLCLQQISVCPQRYSTICPYQLIETLHEKVDFLLNFWENSSHEMDASTVCLQRRIADAAYDIEDFFDLQQSNLLNWINSASSRIEPMHPLANVVDLLDDSFEDHQENMALRRLKDLEKYNFENIGQRIDPVGEEVAKQGDSNLFEDQSAYGSGNPWGAVPSRLGPSSNISAVLFEDHLINLKESIRDELTWQSSNLKVISVVGMAGIGKTTLAKNIYSDPSFVNPFEICAWATISQSYSIRGTLIEILSSMKRFTGDIDGQDDDNLREHIYKNLNGRRYLIILDDIWDDQVWDSLKMLFPNDSNGSRIMLTTQLHDVAAYADSSDPHQMPFLSSDQSWDLLCAKIFGGEPCPLELRDFGTMIAKYCQGLPLLVSVISGLLASVERTIEAWFAVAKDVSSGMASSSHDQCLAILKLSYNYLPHQLKACFLYIGGFPEGLEISASQITKIWISMGVIKQDEAQSLEEVAERCLEELGNRSMILPGKRNFRRKIKTFKMHNLLHVFSIKQAFTEKFLHVTVLDDTEQQYSAPCQRSIIFDPTKKRLSYSTQQLSFARSLVVRGKHSFPSSLLKRYMLLRVLDVESAEFDEFPPEIWGILNLRYIAVGHIRSIPSSISNLWNLQTLIIHQVYCKGDKEACLPVEIWNMPNLRHLHFSKIHYHDPADGGQSVLGNLLTLTGIRNLVFTEAMLKRLEKIKKLVITYDPLSWEKGLQYYHFENLVYLHQLEVLNISISSPLSENVNGEAKFSFPAELKKLSLTGCKIPWKDLAIVCSLPNLEVLKLKIGACSGTEWELDEEVFCKLKVLSLDGLELEHWRAECDHFPTLERLVLHNCKYLEEIPSAFGESCTLMQIEMDDKNPSALASAQEILQTQHSLGNYGFQVLHS